MTTPQMDPQSDAATEPDIAHAEEHEEQPQATLSQRELVRASLLRCPPSPGDTPRP
jgi:hypothetical protein